MAKKKTKQKPKQTIEPSDNLRLNPEARVASKFDDVTIAKFPVGKPGKMGFRVLDDCAEEHIM